MLHRHTQPTMNTESGGALGRLHRVEHQYLTASVSQVILPGSFTRTVFT
jgi:hypothetical protein